MPRDNPIKQPLADKGLSRLTRLFLSSMLLFFASSSTLAIASNTIASNTDQNLPQASLQLESLVVGAGCFWGVEKRFAAIEGVTDVVSGYAGGDGVKPRYRDITLPRNKFNPNNHAEVVQITFEPQRVSVETLLQHFYEMHDPTQQNRQGNDIGTQYRSVIFYNSAEQAASAKAVTARFQPLLNAAGFGPIQTQIQPLKTFYPAEDFHQDYLVKNPNGYCPDHATGVRFSGAPVLSAEIDNSALLQGKHIVMLDAPDCPYCEKFKADVVQHYQGKIPLHLRRTNQLTGLQITTPTWATPTLLFLENGKELLGVQGYMTPADFYKVLGHFSLGEQSEAFNVAFQSATDRPFCQQYEQFKNTPDGVFIDTLSGAPLFDTRDRFNSGTGWLSFSKPVDGAITTKPDYSHGMVRTEVLAAVSGIHLGHVFNDGPNGSTRYCINATVLEFVAR